MTFKRLTDLDVAGKRVFIRADLNVPQDDNLAITQVNASHLVLTQYDLVTMSDATLHEIISHIETTFGVRLSVPGRYGDKRYTFNYQRSNSLEEVLNIVEYLTGEHCEVIYRKK